MITESVFNANSSKWENVPHKPTSTETVTLINTEKQNSTVSGILLGRLTRCWMDPWEVRFAGGWAGSGPRFQTSLLGDECRARNSASPASSPVCAMMGDY